MEAWRDELYHFGVMGMKWGVRRYQNPDGSLTAAGRKRYGTDLDINDKSRLNIARIRTGEARRRLDNAKQKEKKNGYTNPYRIAELKSRERAAKKMESKMKKIDKGAKLYAKGQTITGNNVKILATLGANEIANHYMTSTLNATIKNLSRRGTLRSGHIAAAKTINAIGSMTINAAGIAYMAKKLHDNASIRAYNRSTWNGESTIKNVGSEEYKDVVERRKKH